MGDAFDLYEAGILDEMGEYIGDDCDYRKRRKGKFRGEPNPRKGVMSYAHRLYIGKARMPKTISIVKHYAKEMGIDCKTEPEMFAAISSNFKAFIKWMKDNAGKMYQTY